MCLITDDTQGFIPENVKKLLMDAVSVAFVFKTLVLLIHCSCKLKCHKNSFAVYRFVFLINKRYTQDTTLSPMLICIYVNIVAYHSHVHYLNMHFYFLW